MIYVKVLHDTCHMTNTLKFLPVVVVGLLLSLLLGCCYIINIGEY